MASFRLNCQVTVGAYTEVEAETLEEAIKISEWREVVVGGSCSDADPSESWVIEAADGSPHEIYCDEA